MPNARIDQPKDTNFAPKRARSLSPVKKETRPPVFGTVPANLVNARPALAAAVTTSGSIPAVASANPLMPSPRSSSPSPNASKSLLSPVIKETKPPLFGTVPASFVNVRPTCAAALTVSGLIPAVATAKALIPSPSNLRSSLNPSRSSFSPTILARIPPSFGISAVASAKVFKALAEAVIAGPSILSPPTVLEKLLIAVPRGTKAAVNLVRASSPVIQEVIALSRSAPVKIRIVDARDLTPSSMDASNPEAPSINGWRFVMNVERFVAISGRPEVIPALKPPTILPTKFPIAYPTVARNSPPSATSSCKPGILLRPPAITSTPASMPRTAANATAPEIATIAPAPIFERIRVAVDSAIKSVESPITVSRLVEISKAEISASTRPTPITIAPRTATAPIAVREIACALLRIKVAAVKASNRIERDAVTPRQVSIGMPDSKYRIPATAAITPVIIPTDTSAEVEILPALLTI